MQRQTERLEKRSYPFGEFMAGNTLAIHQNLDRPGRQMCAHSIAQARVEYFRGSSPGVKVKSGTSAGEAGGALGTSFLYGPIF
jgi:hypothetical protein